MTSENCPTLIRICFFLVVEKLRLCIQKLALKLTKPLEICATAVSHILFRTIEKEIRNGRNLPNFLPFVYFAFVVLELEPILGQLFSSFCSKSEIVTWCKKTAEIFSNFWRLFSGVPRGHIQKKNVDVGSLSRLQRDIKENTAMTLTGWLIHTNGVY